MHALKTKDRQFTSNPSQLPSSSRRKRSSQASSELSSSEECLVAEKMEKKGKENEAEKKRETGELKASPKIYCEYDSEQGKLQKQTKTKTITSRVKEHDPYKPPGEDRNEGIPERNNKGNVSILYQQEIGERSWEQRF